MLIRAYMDEVRFNDTGFRCAKDPIDETQTNR